MRDSLSLALFAAALVACGHPNHKDKSPSSVELSYQFIDSNGCDTGKHVFATDEERCTALKSNELNHSCAEAARREEFKAKTCAGTFPVALPGGGGEPGPVGGGTPTPLPPPTPQASPAPPAPPANPTPGIPS